MICLTFVLMVSELLVFVDSSSEKHYIISDDKRTWEEAAMKTSVSEVQLFTKLFREIPAEKLKLNEKYWIPARANYTRFFSWKGCVEISNQIGRCWKKTFTLEQNSIDKCSTKCSEIEAYVFLLKGKECLCTTDINCFAREKQNSCDEPCPGNLNDFCGRSSSGVYTLYYSSQDDVNKSATTGQHCVYSSGGVLTAENCWNDGVVNGFLYSRNAKETHISPTTISWITAFNKCFEKGYEFIEEHNFNINAAGKFWISLRRSLKLKWTTISDTNFPFCVTIRRAKNNTFIIEEDDCNRQYHYIMTDNGSLLWLLLLLLVPLAVIIMILLKRIKLSRSEDFRESGTSVGNKIYGEIIPANRQIQASQAARYQYAEVESDPVYSKTVKFANPSAPERSVEVSAYQVTSLDCNVYNHIDDGSGNVYNTTRSPNNTVVKVSNNMYSAVQPKHIDGDTDSDNIYNKTNEQEEHMIDNSTYGWEGAKLQMSNMEVNDVIPSKSQASGTLESEKDGGYETVFFKKVVEED